MPVCVTDVCMESAPMATHTATTKQNLPGPTHTFDAECESLDSGTKTDLFQIYAVDVLSVAGAVIWRALAGYVAVRKVT